MKIVHCILDDKFLDTPIQQFGSQEGVSNEWYCLNQSIRSPKKSFKWVKSPLPRFVSCSYFQERCKNRDFCDVIILHSLYALPFYITPKIHRDIKVVWFAWGFDLYSNQWPAKPLIPVDKFKPFTEEFLKSEKKGLRFYLSRLKISLDPRISYRLFTEAVHRIDYFSGVFPLEYDLLMKSKYFRAEKVEFNYVNEDPQVWSSKSIYSDEICNEGENILIGNSGTPMICHLDILEALQKLDLKDRKLVVPLSYSGTKTYIDTVCKKGAELHGDNFMPLTGFLPYREYNDILKTCGIAVFYIEQQGAVGNVFSVLWNGGKVFLSKTSMNYQFMKSIGLSVFTIQDELTLENIESPLTREEVIRNREIISEHYSYEKAREKIRKLLMKVESNIREDGCRKWQECKQEQI